MNVSLTLRARIFGPNALRHAQKPEAQSREDHRHMFLELNDACVIDTVR
jgi:hypothetical protein